MNFTGFGKFSTQHRKERQGVNPRNPSQKVTIPAATVPKFSAGSKLKQAVKAAAVAAAWAAGTAVAAEEASSPEPIKVLNGGPRERPSRCCAPNAPLASLS